MVMSRVLLSRLAGPLLAAVLTLAAASGWAQDASPCGKFDEDTQLQADLCSAHLGCRMVLKIQSTCTRVTDFLGRIKSAVGEGAASLFGRRNALDANQLFDAAIPPESAKAAADPEWSRRSAAVRQSVQGAPRGSLAQPSIADPNGKWVFYGESRDGKANGPGVAVFENGEVQRGRFVDNKLEGDAETLRADGTRRLAENVAGKEEGSGFQYYSNGAVYKGGFSGGAIGGQGRLTMANGEVYEGTFRRGQPVEGSRYRADGTLAERGSFDRFQLTKGQRFDGSGQVVATIDREAERANEEVAQREAALRRQQQAADEQLARRRAEEASRRAAAEQADSNYRAKVQAGNPGELLALASEMKDAGDLARSREALRALVARYPDHPLAASAVRQLSALNVPTATATAPASGNPSGAAASASSADCIRQAQRAFSNAVQRGNAQGITFYPGVSGRWELQRVEMEIQLLERCGTDRETLRELSQKREQIEQLRSFCTPERIRRDYISGRAPPHCTQQFVDEAAQRWFAIYQEEHQAVLSGRAVATTAARGGSCDERIKRITDIGGAKIASARGMQENYHFSATMLRAVLAEAERCPDSRDATAIIPGVRQQLEAALAGCRQTAANPGVCDRPAY
jgi:hypothetical protein